MTYDIDKIDKMRETMTSRQIGELLGISGHQVRRICSQCGRPDPKRLRQEKDRQYVLKWYQRGWRAEHIAEQLMKSVAAVRMVLRRAAPKRDVQLSLFDEHEMKKAA